MRAAWIIILSLAFIPAQALNPLSETQWVLKRIVANLQEPGVTPGAVIASPSRQEPDYYYHWVRDAGLTMWTLADYAPRTSPWQQVYQRWASFEAALQKESAQANAGLGEPKFHVNGQVFKGPWGRPQNDGPAIRAAAYMRLFGTPADPVPAADIDYVAKHWREADFDLWEETLGHHFFTRYAQMTSLQMAGRLWLKKDQEKARVLMNEARAIEQSLTAFIDTGRTRVVPTVGLRQGVQKPAGLDVSVILAVLYFGPSPRWSISQSYVLSTALHLEQEFQNLYPINRNYSDMSPAIGRYPEDVYDGNGFGEGHGWFLATFGMGEYYCALVQDLGRRGSLRLDPVNWPFFKAALPDLKAPPMTTLNTSHPEFWSLLRALQNKGQSFVQRSLFHGGADRRYSEQMDRHTGFRRGARDLTWSYAAALRAFAVCHGSQYFVSKKSQGANP